MRSQTLMGLGVLAAGAAATWWYFSMGPGSSAGLVSSPASSSSDPITTALDAGLGGINDALVGLGMTPRGIRNNNPGNLDYIADPARAWNGQVGSDGRFGVYSSPALGVRAMSKQLQKDVRDAGGADTLAGIVSAWAPPSENNTGSYISDVAQRTGLDPNASLDLYSNLPSIVAAMIEHENGQQPYLASDLQQWVYLA